MPLFSQTQGQTKNPTLVFLHGFLGDSNDWGDTIAQLKNDYYCVCLDLPGHGSSVMSKAPLEAGFQYCHQLIKNALNNLAIKQYTLVGYSLGGRIALDYARTQADSDLQGLILESCHTGLTRQTDKIQRDMNDLQWAKRFASENMIENLYKWYQQVIFGDLSEQQKETLIKKRSHNDGVSIANILMATSLSKQTDALPFLRNNSKNKNPLSINYCFGELDIKFKTLAETLSEETAIKVTEFKSTGHNIHQQDPKQYAHFITQHF